MTNLKIRSATKNDIPVILNFIKQLAEQGKLLDQLVATEETLTESLFGSKVFAEVILPCINDQPVGYALYSYHFSTLFGRPSLYLVDLFIEPESRHKGVGKKVLSHLAKLAIKNNCCRFEWSVLEWNKPAIEFYKSIGAQELDDWRTYRLTGDALLKLAKTSESKI